MGNGSSGLTHAQTWREFSVPYKQRSSTPPFRISLMRQKKSGLKRSLLKRLKTNGKPKRPARLVKTDGLSQLAIRLWKMMIETFVPVIIAVVTGTAVLFNKVNHRVTLLDSKVDKLELKLVETYTPKQEFTAAMLRMEDHLIRIEDKMDQLVAKKCN
jgi:hypothetical protein